MLISRNVGWNPEPYSPCIIRFLLLPGCFHCQHEINYFLSHVAPDVCCPSLSVPFPLTITNLEKRKT